MQIWYVLLTISNMISLSFPRLALIAAAAAAAQHNHYLKFLQQMSIQQNLLCLATLTHKSCAKAEWLGINRKEKRTTDVD